jgi:hypothetical protein
VATVAPGSPLGGGLTRTETDLETDPPLPLQLKVKVLSVPKALVVCDPELDLPPDHAPVALQPVVFVEFQLSCVVPPESTVVGLAVKVKVGGAPVTVTVTDLEVLPPLPLQFKV